MANTNFSLYLDNIIERDFTAVSGVIAVPSLYSQDMPGNRLKNQEPKEPARLLSLSPSACGWRFAYRDLPFEIDALGIVASSLSRYGKWRVLGYSIEQIGANQFTFIDYSPTAVISMTNAEGTVSNIDEAIHAPTSDAIQPFDIAQPWSVHFSVPISNTLGDGGSILTGPSHPFCLVLYMKIFDSLGSTLSSVSDWPRLAAEVWEDGVKVQDLGYKALTSGDGQYILFQFDGSIVSDLMDLEIKITSSIGFQGSSTLYSKLLTAAISVENGLLIPAYDTGWQDNSVKNWTSDLFDRLTFDSTIGHLLPEPWNATQLYLYYRDDGLALNPIESHFDNPPEFIGVPSGLVATPKDYIDTGVFVCSKAMRLTYGIPATKEFTTMTALSVESQQTGLQGESYSADSFKIRDGEPIELLVTHSEGLTLMHRIGLDRGTQGAFLISMDPNLPQTYQPLITEWVTCQKISGLKRFPQRYDPDNAAEMLYLITVQFRQRL